MLGWEPTGTEDQAANPARANRHRATILRDGEGFWRP